MIKETPSQIQYRKWHEDIIKIRPQSEKLDNFKRAYSQDFEFLATEISNADIDNRAVEVAIDNMKARKRDLKSDDFKTHVGHFIVSSAAIYANPSPARDYLKEQGWLTEPVIENIEVTADNTYHSIFDRINDAFETFRYWLDDILDYIRQFIDDGKFKAISAIAILAGIIATFWTGHWGWGLGEIAAILIVWAQGEVGEISNIFGAVIGKTLSLMIYVLKVLFYKWWTLLLIIILALCIPYGYKYYEHNRKQKNYQICLHNAKVCIHKEQYNDAIMYINKAMQFEKSTIDSLCAERDKLKQKIDSIERSKELHRKKHR